MPFIQSNAEREERELQALMNSDLEVKKHIAEFDEEYEFRKKLVEARKEAGFTQKEIGLLAGLDYRAISRAETNADISPNLRTLIKYVNAIGYKLEVVKRGEDCSA